MVRSLPPSKFLTDPAFGQRAQTGGLVILPRTASGTALAVHSFQPMAGNGGGVAPKSGQASLA